MAAPRRFFVEFNTHNEASDAWNYKQTKIFEDYDTAYKEYCNILATYIQYGNLDHVGVILFDSYSNRLDGRSWDKPQPEPEPNEEA